MIYVDTSVVLARLLGEQGPAAESFWDGALVASRLVEYETWNCLRTYEASETHGEIASALLGRISFVELRGPVLERALQPFPSPVGTLDALHLASADFLRARSPKLRIATYDERFATAARAMDFEVLSP